MQAPETNNEDRTEPGIIDLTDWDVLSDTEDVVDLTLDTQPADKEKMPWTEQTVAGDARPWDISEDDSQAPPSKPGKKEKKGRGRKRGRKGRKERETQKETQQQQDDPETFMLPEPKRAARILRPSMRRSKAFTREIPTLQEAERVAQQRLREKNYSAVEAHGWFGLIDSGCPSKGVRELVAHTPRHNGGFTLDRLRAGQEIHLRSAKNEDGAAIRIRFTTPERYYAPGRKITTLSIGVDDAAWLRLVNPR